jgi:serine/threonine-protein kinase
VLYELATTTRLFKGDNDYLVMDQIVNGRVSLPRVRRPELPNELSAIIMRAIAPDPERRYFTADELRVALDQFANKAGLTASTSTIGAYLRKQFGERPEPWLELEGQGTHSFDDFQMAVDESHPSNSWTELPRGDEPFRRSSGAIPRQTGSISVIASNPTSDIVAAEGTRQRTAVARLPSTPPPTDSKMGWESQQPARAPRTFTPAKVAMICAPLILILGVAIWRLAVTSSTDSPVVATSASTSTTGRPAMQVPPPTAPVVTPIPEPQRLVQEPTAGSDAALSRGAARVTEPAATSKSRSAPATTTTKKAAPVKIAEVTPVTPPSSPKLELPAAAPPPAPVPPSAAPPQSTAPPAAPVAAPVAPLPLPVPAPTPPAPPQTVAPTALDANRISGEKDIVPDDITQAEIGRAGVGTLVGSYKLCITTDGSIATVTPLKATGFPAYDTKIQNTIRSQWRYRPFMVNGKATAVCTAVRFIYSQK